GSAPRLAIDVTTLTTTAPPATVAVSATTVAPGTTLTSGPATTVAGAAVTTVTPPPSDAPTGAALGDGKTADRPLPAGDPAVSTFTFETFDSRWSGTVSGVVETPLYWDDEAGQRCLAVLATLTPEQAAGLVSESWSTP